MTLVNYLRFSLGLFSRITDAGALANIGSAPAASGIVSPRSSDHLARAIWAEHFDVQNSSVNRNSAMEVPAIARARNILVGVIAALPLVELEGETELDQPWLYRTSGAVSPWHRMAWTLDDLIFHGFSLWAVERDADGQITDGVRVPYEQWSADEYTGEIRVDNSPVPAAEVILFAGGFEGLLTAGRSTILQHHALERARLSRATNPIPLLWARPNADDELTDEEFEAMNNAIQASLSQVNAGLVTDHKWDITALGANSVDMFEAARNDVVLDVARLVGIPAALLDGSMSSATLTYSTQEGKRNEFLDFALQFWTAPIEARLSMDDVCTPGRRIRFDKSTLVITEQEPVSAPVED